MTTQRIVRLVHWKATEAPERVERLRAAGFEATWSGLLFTRRDHDRAAAAT